MFVPATRPDRVEKACRTSVDCVILDLEDSVPLPQKDIARVNARRVLDTLQPHSAPILVRINSDPAFTAEDIRSAIHPQTSGLVLPKCNTAVEIDEIVHKIEKIEAATEPATDKTHIFLLIESARGLLNLRELATASDRVAALIFGAEDWCLDMGITRTNAGSELGNARWKISVCAHAFGLAAIDTIYADFHDQEGLMKDSQSARRIGFSGKLAIHPSQIETIHAAFAPSDLEVAEAEVIISAFAAAEAQGLGVVNVNGRMVDAPIAARARRILERVKTKGESS